MHFCDSQRVRSYIEGKRIALVGSGPGVLQNQLGFIDAHEVVVRVNSYKLSSATGRRTDIYYSFFGTSVKKSAQELQRDGVKLCICKCPDAQFMESKWHADNDKMHGVDFRWIYEKRASWWFCDTYVPALDEFLGHFELLGRHVPTTGFSALLTVLAYAPKSVYMTGFDFFQSRVHNVNEAWKPTNNTDPICHVPDRERQWILTSMSQYPITTDKAMADALACRTKPQRQRLQRKHGRRITA